MRKANGIPVAPVHLAVNGPTGTADPIAGGLVASDGSHPNDAGPKVIADQLRMLQRKPLHEFVMHVSFPSSGIPTGIRTFPYPLREEPAVRATCGQFCSDLSTQQGYKHDSLEEVQRVSR